MNRHPTATLLATLLLAAASAAYAAKGGTKGGKATPPPADAPALGLEESDRALAQGRAALEDGLLDMAESKLRDVLENSADRHRRDEATIWLARTWLAQGRAAQALDVLEQLTQGDLKDDALLAEARHAQIDALAQARRIDEAFDLLRSIGDPRPEVLEWAAAAALDAGRLDDAAGFYDRLRTAAPQAIGPSALALADAFLDAGRLDDARALADDLAALDAPHPWVDRLATKRLVRDLDAGADGALEALEAWAGRP